MKFAFVFIAILASAVAYGNRAKVLKEQAKNAGELAMELITKQHLGDILKELTIQNASYKEASRNPELPPKEVSKRDRAWRAWQAGNTEQPKFAIEMEKSSCYRAIHNIVTEQVRIGEIFITDRMGANLCAYPATSDYDQGDEEKWIAPFVKGKSPFYGKAEKDDSTGLLQLQSSFVLKDQGKAVGVVVIGAKVSLGKR